MKYLHDRNIVHRDIKLQNILISDDCKLIKLIDFGFSYKVLNDNKLKIFCGTPCYLSPELLNRKSYDGKMNDIWALGVCFYKIISNQFPFLGNNEKELYSKIKTGQFQKPKGISKAAFDLVNRMIKLVPEDRLTIEEILAHPWLSDL